MTQPPTNEFRKVIFAWAFMGLPFLLFYGWLQFDDFISIKPPIFGFNSLDKPPIGVSSIYLGLQNLKFHKINQPPAEGEKCIVVIGSSNIAGWGDDYRWTTRQRVDPWARNSFSRRLEEILNQNGIRTHVFNLAVDGSRLRSQLFFYFYALLYRPHMIVFALSDWSFIRDGDFRDPKNMLHLNGGLKDLLDGLTSEPVVKKAGPLKEYLKQQPSPHHFWTELANQSELDRVAGEVGSFLDEIYHQIGLPLSCIAPSPQPLVREVSQLNEDERIHGRNDLQPAAIYQEMADLFPKILPLLKASADHVGTSLVFLIPPDASRWRKWYFYEARKKELEEAGIPVVDLRNMPMRPDQETYDGHHFTVEGNKKLAEEFFNATEDRLKKP